MMSVSTPRDRGLLRPLLGSSRASRRRDRHACAVARSDLLVHLVRAARQRDDSELRRTVESMIAEERVKQHHLLAERLEEALRSAPPADNGEHRSASAQGVSVLTPRFRLDDLVLRRARARRWGS